MAVDRHAGGLIHVAQEAAGYDAQLVRQRTEAIGDTLRVSRETVTVYASLAAILA